MVRRLLSLLLAVALLGMTGQSAAYAARGPGTMPSMRMSTADCMKMMQQVAPGRMAKPGNRTGRHMDCTPADCLGCMIAGAGIAAALPDDPTPSLVAYDRRAIQRPGLASPMHGRSLPPDIQPPIA